MCVLYTCSHDHTRWGRGSSGFEFYLQRWNNCTRNNNQSFTLKGKNCSIKQEMSQRWKRSHLIYHVIITPVIWGDLHSKTALFLCCWNKYLVFSVPSLHVAAARGQTDCLSVLLAHGVDLSITDTAGTVGVHILLIWRTLKSCLLHVVSNASAGFNPLHLAAKNDHIECCRKLIQVRGTSSNVCRRKWAEPIVWNVTLFFCG